MALALENIDVDMMLEFLTECRDNGMGKAKLVLVTNDGDDIAQAMYASISACYENEDGYLVETEETLSGNRGRPCIVLSP